MEFPKCQLCEKGVLLPLEVEGASAWVCSNPSCGFYLLLTEEGLKTGRLSREGGDKEGGHNRREG